MAVVTARGAGEDEGSAMMRRCCWWSLTHRGSLILSNTGHIPAQVQEMRMHMSMPHSPTLKKIHCKSQA